MWYSYKSNILSNLNVFRTIYIIFVLLTMQNENEIKKYFKI